MRSWAKRWGIAATCAAACVAGTAVWAVGPSFPPRPSAPAQSRKLDVTAATENVGELYALLVGVDDYGGTLKTLKYAGSDVKRMAAALEKIGFPSDNIRKLVSGAGEASRPSRERILAALDEIVRKSGPNSTVFVAFSGHGFETVEDGAAAFCPTDARVELRGANGDEPYVLQDSAILMADVVEKLQNDDANFKMLIVDACREPAATESGASKRGGIGSRGGAPKGGGSKAFAKIEANGLAFLQSCSSQEFSWEDSKLGGGIFTYYFVEGLGGAASTTGDGVTFLEVCGYAQRKTVEHTNADGFWLQRPSWKFKSADGAAESDDFYLIAPKKPKEAAAKLVEAKELRASGGLANLRAARKLLDEAFGLYRYMDATKEAVVDERKTTTAELASALADEAREKLDVEAFDDAVSLAKEAVDAFESLKTPNDDEPPFVPPKYRELLANCERRRDAWRLLDEAETALTAGNRATAASKVERSLALQDSPRGRDLQARIEKASAELPEDYLSAAGIEFRLIKPGSFMMGNALTPEEIHEKYPGGFVEGYREAPRHKVTLTEPFYMAKYETTVAEFKRFVDATGYKTTAEERGGFTWQSTGSRGMGAFPDRKDWRYPGFKQDSSHPVVGVSFEDVKAYIDWLNENAEYSAELGFKPVYRLPTEAEWEYACRAGSKTEFFWGSDEPEDGEGYLNAADESGTPNGWKWYYYFPFNDGYVATSPVGKFKPNAWGLCDMAGNASEWCADWYGPYDATSQKDPKGPKSGSSRVVRGGSWRSGPEHCRSAYRDRSDPTHRSDFDGFGFRLVLGRALPAEATSTQRQAQNGGTSPSTGTDSSSTSTSSLDWDAEHKAGTAKTLKINGLDYRFHYCPAGSFTMGSPTSESGRDSDETQHRVTLDGFWMLETEVTQAMWKSAMGSNPSWFSSSGGSSKVSGLDTSNFPVERVSWEDCQEFIKKLNSLGVAPSGFQFRLPSEAEWEYACRAGTTGPYAGSSLDSLGWYSGNSGNRTQEVGTKSANAWGLRDMHGNVWEWCEDRYGAYKNLNIVQNPISATTGSLRVLRGGSWDFDARRCRSASRNDLGPTFRDFNCGFRLVLGR